MMTIGHVFIPLNREDDGTVPTDDDQAHFESLPVPLALWEPFEQCFSEHLSELTEGQIDREEKFRFEAAHSHEQTRLFVYQPFYAQIFGRYKPSRHARRERQSAWRKFAP